MRRDRRSHRAAAWRAAALYILSSSSISPLCYSKTEDVKVRVRIEITEERYEEAETISRRRAATPHKRSVPASAAAIERGFKPNPGGIRIYY
jgi:hypothetical protein